MTVAAPDLPLVIVGKTREGSLRALREITGGDGGAPATEGSRRLAAKAGDAFMIWGIDPSPLAVKAAESVLALYRNDSPPDRIFYSCYAGTHSSVLAASLHLGLLDQGCPVCDLPLFDRRVSTEIGVPAMAGVDELGTEVYAFGTGWHSARLEKSLCDLAEVAAPKARACFCSVRGFLDFQARAGGFASRRCALVWPGRELIAASLTRKVPDVKGAVAFCLDLSRRWKDNESQSKGEVIWVDGREAGRSRIRSR